MSLQTDNRFRLQKLSWWLGVPFITALTSVAPYWGWNLAVGIKSWWRIPVVTPGVFDTYVYLHWMGAAADGLVYGRHLKWFGSLVLVPLWRLMGAWASLPELWIASRWLAAALTLLIGSWCVRRWSGLSVWASRAVIAGLWLTLLSLSLRPGMYSWYLPFTVLGVALVAAAHDALWANHFVRAVALSAVSLFLTSLYPWFLVPVALWLAALWLTRFVSWRIWTLPVAVIAAVGAILVLAPYAARWFLDPAQAGLVGMYERNGMAFARVPFFANTVLAILAWIALLFAGARSLFDDLARERLTFVAGGWIVVLLAWFNTPFTGLQIYSDHFISIVAVLAWLSLAAIWSAVGATLNCRPANGAHAVRPYQAMAIALGASLFFLYVLQQPVLRNMWRFDSYAIHLTHWFALAAAAWLIVWRERHPDARLLPRLVASALLIPSLGLGLAGVLPVFIRDLPKVKDVYAKAPVVAWITSNIPAARSMCADPESASFYAAMTGRRVNPAEATLSYPEASERVISNLETLAGAYSVSSSGNLWFFRFYTDHYRTIPCASGSKYSHNAFYAGVFSRLGFDEAGVNELIGCRQSVIDANWRRVSAAIERRTPDEAAFKTLCPAVIMPDVQRSFWRLPSDYVERRASNDVSVWMQP